MIDVSISRKLAILGHLRKGPTTLGELAAHFSRTPAAMRSELKEIFLVEIEQEGFYISVYELDYPDTADPTGVVSLGETTTATSPSMTLAEVISVLALVDSLLVAADPTEAETLTRLRERIVDAVADAGYGSVLWPAPQQAGSEDVYATLSAALADRRYVDIEYYKSDTRSAIPVPAQIAPIEIQTGRRPHVVAIKDDEIRRYRLDRISSAVPTDRKFSQRYAKSIVDAEPEPSGGVEVTLITTLSARWVSESVPISSCEQDGDTLRITLSARPHWLGTLLVRLGDTLLGIEGEAARATIAEQYEALLKNYGDE